MTTIPALRDLDVQRPRQGAVRRRLALVLPFLVLGAILALCTARAGGQTRRVLVAATSLSDARSWDGVVNRMASSGELRLRPTRDDTLLSNRQHQRYDQYYQGVRVFGGDIVRQTEGAEPISVFGELHAGVLVDPTPTLSSNEATTVAERTLPPPLLTERTPELVVLPGDVADYTLAYLVRTKTATDRVVSFVDGRTGVLVQRYSELARQSAVGVGTGVFGDMKKVSAKATAGLFVADDALRPPALATFDMQGDILRTLAFLSGGISLGAADLARSANNTWTDGPNVDGHVHAGFTYDYFYKRFGRRGLDNNDMPMVVLVHPAHRSDVATAPEEIIDLFYLNAFYAGDGVVVYGEGLPPGDPHLPSSQTVNYFSGALDIVAHELTHGVTEFSSGLILQNESGALNEAFSDIMGVSVKFFFRPAGNGLTQANYELGSDVIRPGGVRSFDNPTSLGDPDHYSKRVLGTPDNGGIHTNCAIVDHAFYLAVESGTNRTSGLSVQGVGAANREQMEKIFDRAFTLMLPSRATFALARAATIQAARDLYGAGSRPELAVTQAWTAVGVN